MEKLTLIRLLNEIDEAHTYMDGGRGHIRSIFPVVDDRVTIDVSYTNEAMLRHFDWLRQNPGWVKEGWYMSCPDSVPVVMGDFIKARGMSFSGIVEGENTVGRQDWPVWTVRGPNGLSFILKSHAEFIAPDWEREVTE